MTADVRLEATVNLTQNQDAEQVNENIQLVTLAVADNSRSIAIANELNSQDNKNIFIGNVIAQNNVDTGNATDMLEDNQEKKQSNPADIPKGELNRLRLSEQSFAVKVAFNHDGSIMEIIANDKGEVKVNEIKSSDTPAGSANAPSADTVNAVNAVLVALDLDGDHLDIRADENGQVFVNGEKV